MKKQTYLLTCFIMTLFYSCSSLEESLIENDSPCRISAVTDSIIVVQERDPSLPSKPHKIDIAKLERSRNIAKSNLNSDELLGYGYKTTDGNIGNANNTTFKVLSLDKIKSLSDEYVDSKPTRYFKSEQCSFASFDSYEQKILTSKKITTGFKIGIGRFSIGTKNVLNRIFSSHITSSKNSVYGKLDMLYACYTHKLQSLASSRKRFAIECVSPVFLEGLYNSTMSDVVKHYGEFVVTGYVTGGKAHAYFAAIDESGSNATTREKKMDNDISLSYSWENKDSIKGSYSFGNRNFKADSTTYNYKNIQANLSLYGGNPVNLNLGNTDKISNMNIDLSAWVSSLSDESKFTMIDFTENGIYPINEFIFEENYKQRIDNTVLGLLPEDTEFYTPYIEIVRVFERYSASGEPLYDVATVLITRNDDRIILRSNDAANMTDAQLKQNDDNQVFIERATKIAENKKQFYKLYISINTRSWLTPAYGIPLCIDISKFDENNMQIVYNSKTGVTYLCDTTNKVAFSCMIDYDDSVLDDYGIRQLVDRLPENTSLNINRLINNYRIIGL